MTRSLLIVTLALALTGCLSKAADEAPPAEPIDDAGLIAPPPPPAIALAVATSGVYPVNPGFSPATLEGAAGANVTLTLRNADAVPFIPHDWVLEGVDGAATERVNGGAETTVTFILPAEPGEIKFFCSVGDHRARGMEGTFTIV